MAYKIKRKDYATLAGIFTGCLLAYLMDEEKLGTKLSAFGMASGYILASFYHNHLSK